MPLSASAEGGHTERLSCKNSEAHVLGILAFAGKRYRIRAYARSAAAEANDSDFYVKSCHAGTACKQTEIESRHGAKKPLFTEQWLFCNSQFSITEPKW